GRSPNSLSPAHEQVNRGNRKLTPRPAVASGILIASDSPSRGHGPTPPEGGAYNHWWRDSDPHHYNGHRGDEFLLTNPAATQIRVLLVPPDGITSEISIEMPHPGRSRPEVQVRAARSSHTQYRDASPYYRYW
ncbi:hypothetical protein AVEN_27265-1, partial [Araneus ventricosus]